MHHQNVRARQSRLFQVGRLQLDLSRRAGSSVGSQVLPRQGIAESKQLANGTWQPFARSFAVLGETCHVSDCGATNTAQASSLRLWCACSSPFYWITQLAACLHSRVSSQFSDISLTLRLIWKRVGEFPSSRHLFHGDLLLAEHTALRLVNIFMTQVTLMARTNNGKMTFMI